MYAGQGIAHGLIGYQIRVLSLLRPAQVNALLGNVKGLAVFGQKLPAIPVILRVDAGRQLADELGGRQQQGWHRFTRKMQAALNIRQGQADLAGGEIVALMRLQRALAVGLQHGIGRFRALQHQPEVMHPLQFGHRGWGKALLLHQLYRSCDTVFMIDNGLTGLVIVMVVIVEQLLGFIQEGVQSVALQRGTGCSGMS